VSTDPVRLELYSQLLDAVRECQIEAVRVEQNPVEVPADLRDDETPPLPPGAVNALERAEAIVRRIELAAPREVVRLAAALSGEALQTIAYAVDRPGRSRRQELRDLWAGLPDGPRMESEAELAQRTLQRFADARGAFVRAARADLGASEEDLQ
jgi:hypothetical protein